MLQCGNYNLGRMLLAAAALALAGLPVPSHAQPAEWRNVDAETGRIAEVPALEQLVKDFPASASVRLRLLNALLNAGEQEAAGKQALELAARGYAFSESAEGILSGLLDLDYAAVFRGLTEANRVAVVPSAVVATIPAEFQLVENAWRDPATGDLFATTVVSRKLAVSRGGGAWTEVPLEGAGSLAGMAYDPKARLLWLASGVNELTPGEKAYSALLAIDPATGAIKRRLHANGFVALGDVAVGEDGTVYVADPEQGIIHYASPTDEGLRPLVGQGVFRSPQGMVAVPDSDLLIVSDYRYGLAALDTGSGKVRRIGTASPMALDGIDALLRAGKSLIAVQNGASPMRIVRLAMSDDWLTVDKLTVLERANPAWTEPVGATVSGNELVYVATGQWDRFGPAGAVAEGKTPGATEIRALPLGN